jgi:hypothetical protein
VDTGWVEVKPITLVFGHNSSGKSALLSVLPMLQQTMADPNMETPFVFASETGVDLGAYDEVAYRHQVSLQNPIWLNLELPLSAELPTDHRSLHGRGFAQILKVLGTETKSIQVETAVSYNKKQRQLAVTDFVVKAHGMTVLRVFRRTTAANQPWHYEPESLEQLEVRVFWQHFLPRVAWTSRVRDREKDIQFFYELTMSITQATVETLRHLVHIGPLRDFPRRAYRLTGESPKDVGQRGENWLNILMRARSREQLTEKVNEWLERLGYTLRIDWGKQGYVHPMLKDRRGLEISLKDTGFGISQILPVLIQGFSSDPGTILILEQPEIHLHPRAQAELGDMLVAIARRGVRMLVETHSEHLLLRLQRRIAESNFSDSPNCLKPNEIAVYFIEHLEDQSRVHRVSVNSTGAFVKPPQGLNSFFSDDYSETVIWSQAISRIAREALDAGGH